MAGDRPILPAPRAPINPRLPANRSRRGGVLIEP